MKNKVKREFLGILAQSISIVAEKYIDSKKGDLQIDAIRLVKALKIKTKHYGVSLDGLKKRECASPMVDKSVKRELMFMLANAPLIAIEDYIESLIGEDKEDAIRLANALNIKTKYYSINDEVDNAI